MTAPLKTIEGSGDIAAAMNDIGRRARIAARVLALAPAAQKDKALGTMAKAIRASNAAILKANAEDIVEARGGGATAAFLDRLALDAQRVEGIAEGLDIVAKLADPVGKVMETWTRPNGMIIERVRVPLGVVCCDLREPAECHRRCRGAGAQGRKRRHPARRLGQFPFGARHPCRTDGRPSRRGPS